MDNVLRLSLERGCIVTIVYQGREITQRNIKVLSMEGSKIKAHCYLRDQIRSFDRDRILAADFCRIKSAY